MGHKHVRESTFNPMITPLSAVPVVPVDGFYNRVRSMVEGGGRLSALFAAPAQTQAAPAPDKAGSSLRLYAVVADDSRQGLRLFCCDAPWAYPALTPRCPQAHLFEREIYEQWGVLPEGHPWLKPVRFAEPMRTVQGRSRPRIGITDFFRVQGEDIHEVAVGPIHAGIIEPGHFRFQCFGEIVHHLEISLGYQHRGVEAALLGGPRVRDLSLMETLAGDTSIGHATAYCQAVEGLAGVEAPQRAQIIRALALELERLANHTGDLGALAGDVGYLPTMSFCGRLRGDFLNMTALLCGNRFGRSLLTPGGVRFDAEPERLHELLHRLDATFADVEGAANLLWETPSVSARFEHTGQLSAETARQLGLVGPAARACGLKQDVRRDHPGGWWRRASVGPATQPSGDVYARAYVRWLEIGESVRLIHQAAQELERCGGDSLASTVGPLAPESMAVSLVEGWRGEICHVCLTDAHGRMAYYKVVDPSFHNWTGLAMALRGQQISDFPLCNKSFNLSYCGHDL